MRGLLSIFTFIFFLPPGFTQNLIINSDFENNGQLNCASWYDGCHQELTYLCDTLEPANPCDVMFYKDTPGNNSGIWSLGVTGVGNSIPGSANTYITGQNGTNHYLLNVWMKDVGQAWGGVIIRKRSNGQYVSEKIIPADTLDWTFYSVHDTLTLQLTDSIEISLWAFAAGPSFGNIYFDQVEYILVDSLTSVNDPDDALLSKVSVYPNPTLQYITLDIRDENNEHNIILYRETGEIVKKWVTSDQRVTIDMQQWESGLFFYRVERLKGGLRIGEGKFIVQ